MQCFVCGEQMRVVRVEPHVVDLRGFELRTFQCVGCGDVEKRPVFDSALSAPASASLPERSLSERSLSEPEQAVPPPPQMPVATSKMRSIIGGLVRFRATP
jgi:hypothetical protein